jgi:Glycosyl hydrolases family 39
MASFALPMLACHGKGLAGEQMAKPVRLASSATAPGGGAAHSDSFSIVGVFDVDWLLQPRFERLLDNLSASPGAFKTIRFFGALNSGQLESVAPESSGAVWLDPDSPIDFSTTLRALEALTSRGLIPFISLTFFPSAVSASSTTPPVAFSTWKRLVRAFLDELARDPRFGVSALREWWFEVWNEPNMAVFWKGSFDQYLDFYRATSQAIVESGYAVRLGGPAIAYLGPETGANAGPPLIDRFLSFLHDEPSIKCDFVSFHAKGSWHVEDANPTLERSVAAARRTAESLLAIAPERSQGMAIVNDEADMKVAFDVPFEARMTERFPAWLSSQMIAYQQLSARFREADIRFFAAADDANQQLPRAAFDGRRSVMTPASPSDTDLFKVPVYGFYELLRLQGEQLVDLVSGAEHCYPNTDLFHATTVSDTHLAVLLAVHPRSEGEDAQAWQVEYSLRDVPWPRVNVARFQIDRVRSNGYSAAGRSMPSPYPASDGARRIRLAQELTVFRPIEHRMSLPAGTFRADLRIDPFTVLVYWITPYLSEPPAAPTWLQAVVEAGNVVLRWQPEPSKDFFTYEVFAVQEGRLQARLSPKPLRAAMWIDTSPRKGARVYGVRSVTSSGVTGPLAVSHPVVVPG